MDAATLRRPYTMGPYGLGAAVEVGREPGLRPGHLVACAVAADGTSAGREPSAPVAATTRLPAERVEQEIVRDGVVAAGDPPDAEAT